LCKMERFDGKVALVTASTQGIGFAIARKLAQEGAHVVICSRKKSNVDQALSELKSEGLSVSGLVCHVAKADDRRELIAKIDKDFGGLDMLVSNVAVNPYFGSILSTPGSAYDKIFEVNVKSTFMLIQDAVPLMQKRGGGSVVIVSSTAGYVPSAALGIYSVSKTALLGLTKALMPELSSMNIRVNCIAPGIIQTKFSGALLTDEEAVKNQIPLGRIGKPHDCAGIVALLCSDEAAYITGETIVVAGGSTIILLTCFNDCHLALPGFFLQNNNAVYFYLALVTASTQGIGFAIARKLAQEGAHVVICSRKKSNVDQALSELKSEGLSVSGLVCHVAKAEDRKIVIQKIETDFGRLDMLVLNAAVNPYFGTILGTPESAYDKIFEVNVKSTFLLIQEATPLLKNSGGGNVVIVSSYVGFNPQEGLGFYSVSKTALLGLTKALMPELSSMNIRVNCIAPGVIRTKFSAPILQNEEAVKNRIPLGRVGEPEDCAAIVALLCSDEAAYITGETIMVSGGL
uniref:Dehydrogenase/reductase SDR family member 4 n=1 Tax=Ciona savignyi TaxID=51511 RepID=H2Z9Q7_CIOSA